MLRGGEAVLVGVSGGADSLALLDVLVALAPVFRLSLHVAHVHHGLRPEADADAEAVREASARLRVPFHLERVTVRARASGGPGWEGPEAEARQVRHAAFRTLAAALGATRIATGHSADDQAETVVMRLLAGAGPRGLGGIAPVRGPYVRPLIETRRAAIEDHLRERGLAWVEDATNRDPAFLRNRIRHDVLPFLAARLDPDIVSALGRGAAVARGVVADLERRGTAELERLGRPDGDGLVLPVAALRELAADVGAEVLCQAALRVQSSRAPLRGPAQRALRWLLEAAGPRRPLRLGRARIERSGRWLRVALGARDALAERAWLVPGRLSLPELGASLEARHVPASAGYRPPRHAAVVAFDADRLPSPLVVRGRRPGDRFEPFGGTGTRRLKSFLIDAGVPRWDRARVPLLEAGGEIVWVVGLRRGAAAPVTAESRRILEVTLSAPLAAPWTRE
jgi:tRNA(Ile)-lysidine synthase